MTSDVVHGEAVALTPRHYHSLRLHHAELADGVLGELELVRTRYLDFSCEPAWSSVREPALLISVERRATSSGSPASRPAPCR